MSEQTNQLSKKTTVLLLMGGVLLIVGAVMSLFHPAGLWRFNWVLILIGLALMRIARPSLRDDISRNLIKNRSVCDHSKRKAISIFEFFSYCVTGVLTVTVIVAAYMGYFSDLLTNTFGVVLVVAVFFCSQDGRSTYSDVI